MSVRLVPYPVVMLPLQRDRSGTLRDAPIEVCAMGSGPCADTSVVDLRHIF
jgi:hypothetical protein